MLYLSGGEPLIHPPLVDIIREARRLEFASIGMSTNLNKVAGRFGIRYRYDAVVDLASGGRQIYERPRMFAHFAKLILACRSSPMSIRPQR